MKSVKKYIALAIALVVPFALVGTANAADETVSATTELTPKGKTFYKQKAVSADLKIHAEVHTPESSVFVNPLKNVKVTFPAGMTLKPHNSKTPVCTDSKLNERSSLDNPEAVLETCKKSVVGTGTATILIAKSRFAVVKDPILIAFNAGKNGKGEPKLKIYGYSKLTQVGILMNSTLKGKVLDVPVPVLSSDSAVKVFDLEFPGPRLKRPELGVNTKGRDANYVQAKCARSPFVTNAVFELGERVYPSGVPTTPTTTVVAPETTQNCHGKAGKAKLRVVKVRGPHAVKNGRKATYRVTVRNKGTANARKVVVKSNRGGKDKAGKITPGAKKTFRVKVKIRGKKHRRVRVKFTARSGKVKASAVKRVKVR